jgi:hypothetical protein
VQFLAENSNLKNNSALPLMPNHPRDEDPHVWIPF